MDELPLWGRRARVEGREKDKTRKKREIDNTRGDVVTGRRVPETVVVAATAAAIEYDAYIQYIIHCVCARSIRNAQRLIGF